MIRVELVIWQDPETLSGWRETDEVHAWAKVPLGTCMSVGFVVDENDDTIVIAPNVARGGFGEPTKIAKSLMQERMVLEEWPEP